MQVSLAGQDSRAQSPHQSSVSLDCGNQVIPRPCPAQDDESQESPIANPDRDEAPSTDSVEQSASRMTPTARQMRDEPRLTKAVVIPQRRPSDRARGFVRAYAPDLLRCGIDQATFLRFIDDLNRSVASNPAVQAVDLAGEAVGAVPGSEFVGAPIIGTALQVAAGAYKEINARRGQNSYLTKMNDELFRPRGLYCLIMSYDVKSRGNVVRPGQSDSPSHIIRQGISEGSKSSSMRNNDGMLGASNFPATAQLIYPDPSEAPESISEEDNGGETVKPGIWGSSRAKVQTILTAHAEKEDLKSQVKFQKKNPSSPISPLMDPKAELSEKDRQKQEKREAEQDKKEKKRELEAEKRARKYPEKPPKVHKPKEGILYVMIVNIPSTQDMETARRLMDDRRTSPGLGAA